jgi:pimeloyl-ACP methyl ester carboxylesterase
LQFVAVVIALALGCAGAASAATPQIEWSPCADTPGFDCAEVKAPLDYDTPRNGRKVTLAVVRHAAEGPGTRLGTVFFNPGGPGGQGTEDLPSWLDLFPAEVRQRFDLVSWDPRGVGDSTAAQCFDTDQEGIEFFADVPSPFPVGPGERRSFMDAYHRFGGVCRERQGNLLKHFSTADTARDLDLLRRRSGESKMNYIGVSYGTFLGATYANLFPRKGSLARPRRKHRAVGLDEQRQAQRRPDEYSFPHRVAYRTAETFEQFLRLCAQAGTSTCAFAGSSLQETRAKWQTLLERTADAPGADPVPRPGNRLRPASPKRRRLALRGAAVG